MEAARRYRVLIYFAALVLCLSVCFANAEEVRAAIPAAIPAAAVSGPMIFQSSQLRAGFLESCDFPSPFCLGARETVPKP